MFTQYRYILPGSHQVIMSISKQIEESTVQIAIMVYITFTLLES